MRVLLAADFAWTPDHMFHVHVYVRDNLSGRWNTTEIATGSVAKLKASGGSLSLRAVCVHRDRVTNAERVFILVGTLGIFTGVFDAALDGMIRWDAEPEPLPQLQTRPLAVIEAAGAVLLSSGKYIYKRNDGERPSYSKIFDMGGPSPTSGLGGIRGLTAIPNPNGPGESLLFLYCGANNQSAHGSGACMVRLDPDGHGGYSTHHEACLDNMVSEYLGGVTLHRLLVSRHDIAGIWVAFFSRCQQYRC